MKLASRLWRLAGRPRIPLDSSRVYRVYFGRYGHALRPKSHRAVNFEGHLQADSKEDLAVRELDKILRSDFFAPPSLTERSR